MAQTYLLHSTHSGHLEGEEEKCLLVQSQKIGQSRHRIHSIRFPVKQTMSGVDSIRCECNYKHAPVFHLGEIMQRSVFRIPL